MTDLPDLPTVPRAAPQLVEFAYRLVVDGPGGRAYTLPEIVDGVAAIIEHDGATDRQSGFYKNTAATMKALAEAGHVERIEPQTFGASVSYRAAQADGAVFTLASYAARARDAQQAVNDLGAGPPEAYDLARTDATALATMATNVRPSVQDDANAALDTMADNAERQVQAMPERLTPEEAVRSVMLYDAKEAVFQEGAHLQRFLLGVAARRVSESSGYGDRALERLAQATGVHVNTVRQCRRLAEQYSDSPHQFTRWMKAMRRELGRPARWYHVEKLIGTFSDPTVLGPDELARRVAAGVENAAAKVDLLAGHEAEDGIKVVLTDAARSLREEGMNRLAEVTEDAQADTTPRDPIYLRFVARLPCAATGQVPEGDGWEPTYLGVDAHHVEQGGTAIKGSDYTAVPLCREAHDLLHHDGYRAFRRRYDVNLLEVMFQTLHLYVTEQQASLPSALLASA